MALILAIEPDPQQAALLTDLVRTRVRSDLVLADTTEHALVAIADRVPDLVLIPALMSAREDAALAGALRMIAAAAQVQMVTIPLLAAPVASPEPRGVLSKWRRPRKTGAPLVGCDPAVFADQIAAYLPGDQASGVEDQASGVRHQASEIEHQAPSVSLQASDDVALADDLIEFDDPMVVDEPIVIAERIELVAVVEAASIVEAAPVAETVQIVEAALVAEASPIVEAAPVVEAVEIIEAAPVVEAVVDQDPVSQVARPAWSPRRSFALIDWQADTPHDPVAPAPAVVDAAPVVAPVEEPSIVGPVAEPPALVADIDEAAAALRVEATAEVDAPAEAWLAVDQAAEVVAAVPAMELETAPVELPVEAPAAAAMVEDQPAPIALPVIDAPLFVAAVRPVDESRRAAIVPTTVQEPAPEVNALLALREAELERREAELRLREEALRARDEAPAIIEPPVVAAVQQPAAVTTAQEIIVRASEPADDSFYELSFDELEADAAFVSMMTPPAKPPVPVRPKAPAPALRAQAAPVRLAPTPTPTPTPTPAALPEIEDPLFFFDPAPTAPAVAQAQPQAPSPAPAPASAPVTAAAPAKAARPEWAELIDSLRQDIERLKGERNPPSRSAIVDYHTPAPSAAALNAASAAHSTVTIESRKVKKARSTTKKMPRPAQDEWGLFDPEQCGFASLLAKLSEITDAHESGASSRHLGP